MKSNHQYLSIILNIKAYADRDGCFDIPATLCNLFDIKIDDEIHLIIENKDGLKYNGKKRLHSRYEIRGDDISKIVKAGEIIKVTIFSE